MAYNPNTPQATDRINSTQSPIQTNFAAIKTVIEINHVAFDDPSGNQGKHKFLQMPEQSSNPTTAVNEAGLFAKEGTYTSVAELAFRRENSGSVIEFTQLFASENGWTYLPSGILLKWGQVLNQNGLATVSFPTGATKPAFSALFSVLLSIDQVGSTTDQDETVMLVDFAAGGASFRSITSKRTSTSSTTASYRYLAIGT